MEPLTEAQQALTEKNHAYIYYIIKKLGLPVEDYYGAAAIGLCKAARAYNPSKGTAFSTFAYAVMSNEIMQECRRGAKRIRPVASLDDFLGDSDGDTLSTVIADPIDRIDAIDTRLLLEQAIAHIKNPRTLEIVNLYMAGHRQADIAKHFGISRSCVGMILQSVKEFCKRSLQDKDGGVQYKYSKCLEQARDRNADARKHTK